MSSSRQHRRFTAIIPTRERCDTLEYSLRTLTQQTYENLQIIVSDNYSQDATRDVVRANADPRIRYINTGKRVSMSGNWEFALAHAAEGWVTFLGDDDGLLPGCFEKVNEIIDRTGVRAVKSTYGQYLWPGFTSDSAGDLEVPLGKGFSQRLCRSALSLVLQGANSYTTLPMVYNGGFVDLEAVRAATFSDRFFLSCIPDVFSAIALSNTLDRYVYSHEPFSINGASRHSIGASQFSYGSAPDSAVTKFRLESDIAFHPSVPPTPDGKYPQSLHAFVYESCEQFKKVYPKTLTISPEQQLAVILRGAGNLRETIGPWAQSFALLHGIDYDKIARESLIGAKAMRFHDLEARFKALASIRLDNRDTEIENILAATNRAAIELRSPGFNSTVKAANKLLHKLMRLQ
jgi:glycosyltransferase involved in cell wall biosynthesis